MDDSALDDGRSAKDNFYDLMVDFKHTKVEERKAMEEALNK